MNVNTILQGEDNITPSSDGDTALASIGGNGPFAKEVGSVVLM